MLFTKHVSAVSTHYSTYQDGYIFEIRKSRNKYYVCVQNFNTELEEVDCRIPTYLTAWDNIYFNILNEAKLWCENYLKNRKEVK